MPPRGSDRPRSPEADRESSRQARKERRQAGRRSALLAAAREVLLQEGVAGLTIAAVAARADVSKPAVYYYFRSKEELVGGLVVEILDREVELLLHAIEEAPSGVEALAAVVRVRVDLHAADLDGFRIAYLWPQLATLDPALLREEIYPRSHRVNEALERRLLADRLHEDLHPRRLANVAWLTAQGILSLVASLEKAGGSTRSSVAELRDEACAMLRHTAAPGRRAR